MAIRRTDGRLLGWVLAERPRGGLGPGTQDPRAASIYYPENYLDEALWTSGLSIGAYFHALSRQAVRHGPGSLAVYRTHPGAPRMLHLTLRRIAPLAERVDTVWAARKDLCRSPPHPGLAGPEGVQGPKPMAGRPPAGR